MIFSARKLFLIGALFFLANFAIAQPGAPPPDPGAPVPISGIEILIGAGAALGVGRFFKGKKIFNK